MNNKFSELFSVKKPIIGMIHLAGDTREEMIKRALEELTIYNEEGVDGAIIEDYHGTPDDVVQTLRESSNLDLNLIKGVNILRNPYLGFELADSYGAKFVQFDSVQETDLDITTYRVLKNMHTEIIVLGGVGFKYIKPTENPLEEELENGKSLCEAIVTTGSGTGIETPIDKLKEYRKYLGDFPLIVGAGVNLDNVREQLSIADGAIIGSYFKPYKDTTLPVDAKKVRGLMNIVRDLR